MPNFRYRALTQSGEIVNGSISAPNALEVAHRIEYLGLVPIETVAEEGGGAERGRSRFASFNAPRAQDVTIFTRDLALLLKAGARLDDGLELLAGDRDIGRLRPIVGKIRASVLAGESFAEAIAHHPALFPPIYVALVQVGETSGKLTHILEMLGAERARGEATRRKLSDALQYPAFILLAASCVLLFFILFVLPQFSSVLRDFNAKTDPVVNMFLGLSDFLRAHGPEFVIGSALVIGGCWMLLRRPGVRSAIIAEISRVPGISAVFNFYRTALFCRNLSILLGSDVTLSATLRILVDIMAVTGRSCAVGGDVRPRPPRRQAVRCARSDRHFAAHGDTHAAHRRRDRAVGGARRPRRRFLRGQAAAQPRPGGRDRRSAGDHHHQHRRRRPDRFGHDRTPLHQPARRMKHGRYTMERIGSHTSEVKRLQAHAGARGRVINAASRWSKSWS